MQTHSVQPFTNRSENVQAPFTGFAGGRESSVRTPNYLTPLKLAGHRPVFSADVHALTKSIQKEVSVQYLRESLANSMTYITAFEAAGYIHTPDLNKLHRAAISANLTGFTKALTGLFNTALSHLKHDIVAHVKTVFSAIEGMEPYLEQVFSSAEIYGLQFDTDTRTSTGELEPLALKIYSKPFMDLVFLDLPLEGEGKEITPFLWNTISSLIRRGGGVICEDVYSCSRGYIVDHTNEEVTAWLSNAITEIESLPTDEPVAYLFDVDCSKVKAFIDELECCHWVFEEADSIDDIERDSLLDALNEIYRDIEAMMAHVPYTKGAPTDKAELLNAQWPDHPTTQLIRSLLERHLNASELVLDAFIAPDDMYYPFPFILHPSEETFCDDQSELLNSVYEESMNIGEGFEWYKIDVTHGQWVAQLKDFVTNTCATLLACKIICGHFKN